MIITLEWATVNRVESCGLDSHGPRQGPQVGCCEYDNEPSVSTTKGGECPR